MKKVDYGPNKFGNIIYPDSRKIFGKPRRYGSAKIDFYEIDRHGAIMWLIQHRERVFEGKYVRLTIDNKTVMSNTYMEEASCRPFIKHANGNVLVAGLGMAHTLLPVLSKPEVKRVLTIEKNPDVIGLVWPFVKKSPFAKKAEIVNGDIFQFESQEKWDTLWFDIWTGRSTDNLEEMAKLHRKWTRRLNRENPDAWMGSWYQRELQSMARRERRDSVDWTRCLGGNLQPAEEAK